MVAVVVVLFFNGRVGSGIRNDTDWLAGWLVVVVLDAGWFARGGTASNSGIS